MTIVLDKVIEELVTQKVNALVQTVEDNVKLVRGIDSEIKDLSSDIETFNARLVEASKNPRANDHQVLRVVVKKFRTVVNEAQDTIANYVALKKKHGDDALSKTLDKIPFCGKINAYANEIQSIRAKLDKINQVHENELLYLMKYKIKDRNRAETTLQVRPTMEQNKILGFKDGLEAIKARFLKASKNFIVIPVVGMAGAGKTTFALMIFEDPDIHPNSLRIWVPVTKLCDRKQKFISIIYQITKRTEDFSTMTEEMLEGKIKTLLKDQTYFIVLDDVWEKKDWDSLKNAFPENLNGSKVLVTSRYGNVVDAKWESHNLRELSNEDGWSVIKNNVFSVEGCSDTLEDLGKKIARKCKGLPLALVVVAGILRRCITSDDWRRVADNPLLEINREDQSYHELVKLSYDDLPHEKLKNCFLYFAYFPMGHEIATWKLIRLWIAEEFIPTIDEWGYSLDAEIEAKKYLNDLIDRNLVMVIKRRADGQTKTCRIHDTLYEFCKSEAARKNLFLLMNEGQSLDENTSSTRRLCFHSFTAHIFDAENKSSSRLFLNCYNQRRSPSPFGKHIHSLLLSSPQKSETPFALEQLATIPNTFPLLRVLNIEYIKFKDLPNELYSLYLLKYLAISGNLNVLPKSFRSLRELETLVLKTTARTLQIDGGIWNMEKLRHVHTNTTTQLPFPPETSKTNSGGKDIHTLSTISPESCRKEIFSKTPNLRKLGVRGNLSELFEEKENICLFNNLQMLKCLVNLKLYGQYDKVLTVPMLDKFACRLKKLSFSGTLFEWKDMAVLGLLEELEVLKLDDYAFKGENWELNNNVVFKRLQYLRIGRTNLVTWKATENSFPALQSLILRNCTVIERIPEEFANVHTLKVMELFHVSESATQSVKEIRKNIKNSEFKLVITSQKRAGPMTAAMDTMIEQAVSKAVNDLVREGEIWCSEYSGLEWEIKNLTWDIELFNARLEEAYKNPTQSVNVLIVKNFQTIVNEAFDAVHKWKNMNYRHKHKTLRKFLVPRYRREVKSCETEIQSLRTKVNTINHEHKKELETLCNYELLIFQRVTVYDQVIEVIEQKVNMILQKIKDNVNRALVSDIMDMTSEIKTFAEYLVKACKHPKANEHRVFRVIVKEFRILVHETMIAVYRYFAQEKKYGNNGLAKCLDKIAHCGKPNVYASEIQSIKEKMKRIREDHTKDLLHLLEDYNKLRDMPLPKAENNIVGFIDDLKIIKSRIMEASKDFFVIPIVGNVGTGKTTFALKIFEDPEIRKDFTNCIWVHVSRGFHRKQKFIDILHQISKQTEDFSTELEDELEAKVKGLLEDERYFIVLDDVREKEDWDCLKVVFPTNSKGSRVLVTTWSGNVVDSTWKSHSLGKLSNNDGWLLIKNNVFGTEGWRGTLIEELGLKIAEKCNGLPHALVLVAGILRNCITSAGWQQVADNPLLEINGEDQSYNELVKFSYDDLSYKGLKNCFLYFAYFPLGHEIVAWKLIRLWNAEGFISIEDEWMYYLDNEAQASKYLNILVDRNLVMVKKRSADGQIKTCCIHDTLHEFCRSEAEWTRLFHVIDEGQRLTSRIRLNRLCYYYTKNTDSFSNLFNIPEEKNLFNKRIPRQVGGKYVKSLLLSSSQKCEIHLTPEQLETILKTFKYLWVLNIEPLIFSWLPNELYSQESCMRYLAITADISSLPKSFEHLSCLETLVIKTTERALKIDGGIWNMEKLRHVHTNTSTQLPSPPKTSKHGRKQTDICTLSTISPESCTSEIFNMTPRLRKLGVRGDLSELLLEKKQNVCLFNHLQMLECLENLKLHGNSEELGLKVPMVDKFPRRLRKLTLSGTLFPWNDMTILGLLEELEVLKLNDNAFSGELWDLKSYVIFKGLKYLRIGKMNLINWTAVELEKSFPVLESLVLKNCISLQNIPQDFANLDSLQLMELFDVSERVADFAREICEKRHGKTNVKINGFNPFITPLPSQATVHNQAYGNEHVKTSGFDHPSTSTSSQEIVHSQAYGDENVNTSGLGNPKTSISPQEIISILS